ncbi:unnamed protein product, partial [Rotaria sp. Silwood1]
IGATSSGEIYNLHATILDKNYENFQQRTCQPLAIELAKMFSSSGLIFILNNKINFFFVLVDSGKTGYIVDKKRIQEIREKYGKKYPDFLGKDKNRSYKSESIIGQLYHNALYYINGQIDQLNQIFPQLNINDKQQTQSTQCSLVKQINTIDQQNVSINLVDTSMQLHPGSPLSPIQNSISINVLLFRKKLIFKEYLLQLDGIRVSLDYEMQCETLY